MSICCIVFSVLSRVEHDFHVVHCRADESSSDSSSMAASTSSFASSTRRRWPPAACLTAMILLLCFLFLFYACGKILTILLRGGIPIGRKICLLFLATVNVREWQEPPNGGSKKVEFPVIIFANRRSIDSEFRPCFRTILQLASGLEQQIVHLGRDLQGSQAGLDG